MRNANKRTDFKGVMRGWLALSIATALAYTSSMAMVSESAAAGGRAVASQASAVGPMTASMTVNGDAKRGRLLFLQCRACHSLEAGGMNKVGPSLYGLLGASAGKVEGFVYSEALLASGIVWSPETLDTWLAAPSEMVPGNRMIFTGVADSEDRADIIAYLIEATASEE